MLARLILALLLAAFALPASAPAACHDAAAMTGMSMPASVPMEHAPEQKATPPHGCIGCVPPSNWMAARAPDAIPRAPAMLIARVAVLDIRGAAAPMLRPPRTV